MHELGIPYNVVMIVGGYGVMVNSRNCIDRFWGALLLMFELVVIFYQIVVGGMHLDDAYCDEEQTGNGLGQWLLINGVFLLLCFMVKVCAVSANAGHGDDQVKNTAQCGICFAAFLFAWWIYGQVLAYKDHPEDKFHCDDAVWYGAILYIFAIYATVPLVCCSMVNVFLVNMCFGDTDMTLAEDDDYYPDQYPPEYPAENASKAQV